MLANLVSFLPCATAVLWIVAFCRRKNINILFRVLIVAMMLITIFQSLYILNAMANQFGFVQDTFVLYLFVQLAFPAIVYLLFFHVSHRSALAFQRTFVFLPAIVLSLAMQIVITQMDSREISFFIHKIIMNEPNINFTFSKWGEWAGLIYRFGIAISYVETVVVIPSSIVQVLNFNRQTKNYYSGTLKGDTHFSYRVLGVMLGVMLWRSMQLQVFFSTSQTFILVMSVLLSLCLFIVGWYISVYSFEDDSFFEASEKQPEKMNASDLTPVKRKETEDEINLRMQALFQQKQVYLDPDLTIVLVAQMMEVDVQILLKIFHNKLKLNFTDYVNRYRIEHAKSLMMSSTRNVTMDVIALKSGFHSQGNFVSVFKSITGVYPLNWQFNKTVGAS